MRTECIITGCKLILSNEGSMCHGDLFVLGSDVFIFNSVTHYDSGAAVRVDGVDLPALFKSDRMAVRVNSNDCFEKRGMFVFHRTSCVFNAAALEYVGDRLP